jgi:hypothetical protein
MLESSYFSCRITFHICITHGRYVFQCLSYIRHIDTRNKMNQLICAYPHSWTTIAGAMVGQHIMHKLISQQYCLKISLYNVSIKLGNSEEISNRSNLNIKSALVKHYPVLCYCPALLLSSVSLIVHHIQLDNRQAPCINNEIHSLLISYMCICLFVFSFKHGTV